MNNPRVSIWNASTITWCNKDTINSQGFFLLFGDPLCPKTFLRTLMFGILGVTTPSESFVSELVQAKSALIHRSSVWNRWEVSGSPTWWGKNHRSLEVWAPKPETNGFSPLKAWMVGIQAFPFGAKRPIFRGELAVSFRECFFIPVDLFECLEQKPELCFLCGGNFKNGGKVKVTASWYKISASVVEFTEHPGAGKIS